MPCQPPKSPRELSREALVEIAEYAQGGLFWDIRGSREFWNLDKDVRGSDFIEHMTGILAKHDLEPQELTEG
jgi:hypothetical protein